jgi:thiol-disulfide isomerase/thioredoxin
MKSYLAPALVAAALLQGVLIARGVLLREPEPATYRTLSVGDSVTSLSTLMRDEHRSTLSLLRTDGKPTVLLAFNPACHHCESVAPLWREWLQAPKPAHVLAITSGSLARAVEYRDRHQWNVDLVSVAGAARYTPEHLLVSRVPWVAVFDKHGVLRLFEHGESLPKVDSLLGDLIEGTT